MLKKRVGAYGETVAAASFVTPMYMTLHLLKWRVFWRRLMKTDANRENGSSPDSGVVCRSIMWCCFKNRLVKGEMCKIGGFVCDFCGETGSLIPRNSGIRKLYNLCAATEYSLCGELEYAPNPVKVLGTTGGLSVKCNAELKLRKDLGIAYRLDLKWGIYSIAGCGIWFDMMSR